MKRNQGSVGQKNQRAVRGLCGWKLVRLSEVEALIFLDLFCLGLDEMVIPPKAGRKVTQYPDNKQGLERKSDCFSRIGFR